MGSYTLNSSTVTSKTATYANMVFNARSVDSTGVKLRSENSITFTVDKACTMTAEVSGKGIAVAGTTTSTGTVSVALKAGTYTITGSTSGSNSTISKITFAASGSETTTKAATTTTKKETTTTTTKKETTTEATTTTAKATTTATTTKSSSSSSNSIKFSKSSISVKPGASATLNIDASGEYYIEQEGASWWLESDFLNVWGSNSDKKLTGKTQTFTINQWCGLANGYKFTLTAHLVSDPSVTSTVTVTVKS
jgi:uncharacterized cupredoxin-like copper-binding protein